MLTNVVALFIGAVSTFIATSAVEILKSRSQDKRLQRNFVIFLRLETNAIAKVLNLIKDHHREAFISYQHINQLDKHISDLDSSRKDSVYLDNQNVQTRFFDLATDLSTYSANLRGLQSLKDEQEKALNDRESAGDDVKSEKGLLQKFYEDQKQALLVDNVDLQRKIDELARILEEYTTK